MVSRTDDGALIGIITDGDLRRNMGPGLLDQATADIMTPDPKVVAPDTLASAALEMINKLEHHRLVRRRWRKNPVGIVHVHDLLRAGVA